MIPYMYKNIHFYSVKLDMPRNSVNTVCVCVCVCVYVCARACASLCNTILWGNFLCVINIF